MKLIGNHGPINSFWRRTSEKPAKKHLLFHSKLWSQGFTSSSCPETIGGDNMRKHIEFTALAVCLAAAPPVAAEELANVKAVAASFSEFAPAIRLI